MAANLEQKVAIVTGAARGQGAVEAELLARAGAAVVLADILDSEGESHAAALRSMGLTAVYKHLDVASSSDWQRVVSQAETELDQPVTVLVNNAGVVSFAGVDATDDEWHRMVAVNQTGVFYGIRSVVPSMRRAGGGAIVNVASVFGLTGVPGYFAYQASKGAVVQMTRAAAVDLATASIRVNCVCPGLIFTPMTLTEPPEMVDENIRMTPLQRGGEAKEVGELVVFLVSDASSYVTGAILPVDGGYTAQ